MPGQVRDGGDGLDEATIGVAAGRGDATTRAAKPATRARWGLFLGLAATIIALDQLTKAWIVDNVDPAHPLMLVGENLRLVVSHNTGALFGLFRDQAPLFALVSVGVIGLIGWYHGHSGRSTYLSIALGLLLGGAIGNFLDRFRLGYVVDFVDAGIGNLRWYTFNVADSAISLALVMLLAAAIWPALTTGETGTRGQGRGGSQRGGPGSSAVPDGSARIGQGVDD
jgi:signal peptidase II